MPTNKELVTQLYIGYYNRAADPEGLSYWLARMDAGVSLVDVANSFATSPEAIATYPYLAYPNLANAGSFIDSVYTNVLGRAADADGKAYYVEQLTSGKVSIGQIISVITQNALTNTTAGNTDKAFLENKTAVAVTWVDDAANKAGFTYDNAAKNSATTILNGVTADAATVTTAKAEVEKFFANIGVTGEVFTLTTGVDNLVGTVNNDTFLASVTSTTPGLNVLGSLDKIDGGAGVDTFNVVDTATGAAASFVFPTGFSATNIENLSVTTNGSLGNKGTSVLDLTGFNGLTKFTGTAAGTANHDVKAAGTTDVNLTVGGAATTDVNGGKSVSITGGGAATVTDASGANTGGTLTSVSLTKVDANSNLKGGALTSVTVGGATTAARTIAVDNGTTDHAITLHAVGTGYDSSGAVRATTFTDAHATTITVDATGAKSNVSLAGSSLVKTVNITGSADLTLNASLGSVTKIDGSAATGALNLGALDAATVAVSTGSGADTFGIAATAKFTADAGAGNDVVTLTSAVAAGSTLNTGAGNDIVNLTSTVAAGSTLNLGDGDDMFFATGGGSVAASTASATTVIDGGAGVDTLSASLINAGNAGQFINFEHLDISNSATLDAELMTGSTITGLTLTGGVVGATLTNVAAGVGLTVEGNNTGTTTIGVKGATAGAADSFKVAFVGEAAASAPPSADVHAGTVVVAGVENFTIDSSGTNRWNDLTLGADASANTVKISGASNLDLAFASGFGNATSHTGVSLIDGSTATGNLDINTAGVGAATAGLTVNGGAGDDTITFSEDGGVATGGAGNDAFDVHLAVAGSAVAATAVIANITDMAASETIQFKDASGTTDFVTSKIDVSSATNLQSALDLAAVTNVTANDAHFTWFQYGGNTYVVEDLSTDTSLAATDVVVKLTGIHDLSTSTVSNAELFTHG